MNLSLRVFKVLRSYFVSHVGLELFRASVKGKGQLGVRCNSGSNYQLVRSKLKLNTKSIAAFVEIYIYKRFILRLLLNTLSSESLVSRNYEQRDIT